METAESPIAADRVKDIYAELEGVRGYFFRADRKEWLIAPRAADYLKLLCETAVTERGSHHAKLKEEAL